MKKNNKTGIVTVLYRSESVLEEFFETLDGQTCRDFVLYVVDNKSPDRSLALSRELAEKVGFQTVFIENDDNYGVAKGNNIGIEAALADGCDMVLLSNNDIVLEPATIETLLDDMRQEGWDMAVPKIWSHGTDLFWYCGGHITWLCNTHDGMGEQDRGQFDQKRMVGYAPTCFMLVRKEVFERVGMMDEHYFVYVDDVDFVHRALKAGCVLGYTPRSRMWHKESVCTKSESSDFARYYMSRNWVYFNLKHRSRLHRLLLELRHMAEMAARRVVGGGQKEKIRLIRKARRDGRALYRTTQSDT